MDLATLKAQRDALKNTSVLIPAERQEEAAILKEIETEAARIKTERKAVFELDRMSAHYAARERLTAAGEAHIPIESRVIDDYGAFVVRAPSKPEVDRLLEGAKGKNADAAEATFAANVTLYPPTSELTGKLTAAPLLVKTIVNLSMAIGGLRQANEF